ncbi:MAG: stearoyl-CoA desaturase (delta-9 desaturase) [Candidatus Midichloriaceae bacterium]|jgi:stearoyl-CoA desaturase (delta-9 desaturase)
MMKKVNINYQALFVTIIYPVILGVLTYVYCSYYEIGKFEIISIVASYYIINISVGVGLHRLWSHAAFKTKKWVEVVLAILTAGTLQGPILAWASDHMIHHKYTDVVGKDPHTALKFKNKVIGFLWSHMGWMIFSDTKKKKIDRMTLVKLGKNKIVMWQFNHYWKIAIFVNTVVPMALGYLIGGDLRYAIAGFVFMGVGRAIQQQATFCVNSLVHVSMGTQKYYYGTARDIWWLFFMLLGENWHNFHHAFASDYRNGHKWYQFDVHKWVIALMSKVGLASDLVVTSDVRIKDMVNEVSKKFESGLRSELEYIESSTMQIQELAIKRLKKTEKSAIKFASDVNDNLKALVSKTKDMITYVNQVRLEGVNLEERVVRRILKSYNDLKKIAEQLEIQVATI